MGFCAWVIFRSKDKKIVILDISVAFYTLASKCLGFVIDHLFDEFNTCSCLLSDLPMSPVANGILPTPSPELDVPLANPHLLHRLVSEGNLSGVR